MGMHGGTVSLWDETAAEPDLTAPFEPGGPRVDVAVVGGGYTGLSTALHAAERGLSVHLVEAERIGHGGSGRNVGLVNAAAWLPPAEVRKTLGPTYGPRFLDRFGKGPATVFELIEAHQIRCEAVRNGTIHAAHAPAGLADLKARHAEWQRMGEPVDLLGRAEVRDLVGTDRFHGGLVDRRAGTINPMGYCRGLARAARGAGARISTGVRATALRPVAGGWRVETAQGPIEARQVVLGTNAYTDALWPGLARVFTPIHYLQLSTAPLGAEAAHILPGRQGLWDTAPIMSSLRRDAAGRLMVGSMGRVFGTAGAGLTRRWGERFVARLFPDLGPVRFEAAWHGRIAMTADHLPRVLRLADGLWTPVGYNGRGIGTGTVFGMAMAELLTGADPATLPVPVTAMDEAPRAGLAERLYDLAFTANQIWKSVT
ncbi:MAG: FAD-binding oxidoreductase [Rhodobacteraceae bacterium]|jgi:glycine/D-amino acid oxidase-like deaminating enzyme|nr:FAD-binding oxidoreductase [Paracoccaceae bacterium]